MSELGKGWKKDWYDAVGNLSYRAESLSNATQAFADTLFLDILTAKRNQLVYGRRGTGKTHLLKRVAEEFTENFEVHRVIPVYLNGSSINQASSPLREQPDIIALSLYIEIIRRLAHELTEFINDKLDPTLLQRMFGSENAENVTRAQQLAGELDLLLRKGEVRILPSGESSEESKSLQEALAELNAGANLKLSDPQKIGFGVDIEMKGTAKEQKTGIRTQTLKGKVVLPFSEVSRLLEELLQLLEDSSLVLLVDEWSDIDRSLDVQPHLGDMLKRTLASVTGMYVKLACIPMRTRLSTPITAKKPIPLGYEEGNDIFADINLDQIAYDENYLEELIPFFMTVLQKHISIGMPKIASMTPEYFQNFAIHEIFENIEVFQEICQASAAVPRDFLHLFQLATTMQREGIKSRITLAHVRRASQRVYEEKKTALETSASAIKLHNKIYKKIVAKHRTYLFLLPEDFSCHEDVQILWTARLIHRLPITYENIESFESYIYYQMDHGRCVALRLQQAQKEGNEKGQQWASMVSSIAQSCGEQELARLLKPLAKRLLPFVASYIEKRKALAGDPAGNMIPNPDNITVGSEFFSQ